MSCFLILKTKKSICVFLTLIIHEGKRACGVIVFFARNKSMDGSGNQYSFIGPYPRVFISFSNVSCTVLHSLMIDKVLNTPKKECWYKETSIYLIFVSSSYLFLIFHILHNNWFEKINHTENQSLFLRKEIEYGKFKAEKT